MGEFGGRARAFGQVALLAWVLVLVSVQTGTTGAVARRACFPPHSRTLLADHQARVYGKGTFALTGGPAIYGCAYSHRRPLALDDTDGVVAFPPPAISLAGPIVGYAADICDAAQGTCSTGVFAEDLTLAGTPKQGTVLARSPASPDGLDVVKVGSLRVTRRGSLAWIVCPPHGDQYNGNLTADPRPNCTYPGDADEVVELTAGNPRPVVLDRGTGIDPRSLRLAHGQLNWIDHHLRQYAALT